MESPIKSEGDYIVKKRSKIRLVLMTLILLLAMVLLFCSCDKKSQGKTISKDDTHNSPMNESTHSTDMDTESENSNLLSKDEIMNSWIGKYEEYYSNSYNQFSKEVYEEEYIPYIELLEDGIYQYNINWYIGMKLISGSWSLDEHNEDIVHLSKTEWINDDIKMIRISEGELMLLEPDVIAFENELSTSQQGDMFLKKGLSSAPSSNISELEN